MIAIILILAFLAYIIFLALSKRFAAWSKKHPYISAGILVILLLGILFSALVLSYQYMFPDDQQEIVSKEQPKSITTVPQSSSGEYIGSMITPDPRKINRLTSIPKEQPAEPNMVLLQMGNVVFQTNQPIKIGWLESGEIKTIDWLPNMSGGYDFFPIGTTEYYVFGGSGNAVLTVYSAEFLKI